MADSSLKAISGSGDQSSTQTPQTAGTANNGSVNSSDVQSGTQQSVLNNQQGVELKDTPLTTIDLGAKSTASTAQPVPEAKHHHINPALGAFSVALFILAIILFWLTSRSVKKTT